MKRFLGWFVPLILSLLANYFICKLPLEWIGMCDKEGSFTLLHWVCCQATLIPVVISCFVYTVVRDIVDDEYIVHSYNNTKESLGDIFDRATRNANIDYLRNKGKYSQAEHLRNEYKKQDLLKSMEKNTKR